jgi:hypothetical protein
MSHSARSRASSLRVPLLHTILQPGHDPHRDRTAWLGREDSNLCIPESAFAKTLSLGGGTRTSASGNQIRSTHCRTSADLMLSVGCPPTR